MFKKKKLFFFLPFSPKSIQWELLDEVKFIKQSFIHNIPLFLKRAFWFGGIPQHLMQSAISSSLLLTLRMKCVYCSVVSWQSTLCSLKASKGIVFSDEIYLKAAALPCCISATDVAKVCRAVWDWSFQISPQHSIVSSPNPSHQMSQWFGDAVQSHVERCDSK